jgi:hypothetical protein
MSDQFFLELDGFKYHEHIPYSRMDLLLACEANNCKNGAAPLVNQSTINNRNGTLVQINSSNVQSDTRLCSIFFPTEAFANFYFSHSHDSILSPCYYLSVTH